MAGSKKRKKEFDPFDEDTYPTDDPEQAEGTLVWPAALDTILNNRPPGTEDAYDERLTTQEIQTIIYNHCGQAPPKPDLVEDLTQRGYVCAMLGSGLEWLLKRKV